jgi:hypothetical protein
MAFRMVWKAFHSIWMAVPQHQSASDVLWSASGVESAWYLSKKVTFLIKRLQFGVQTSRQGYNAFKRKD